jgi:dihydrofolate reductase
VSNVIVIQFVTLDGVTEDPVGSEDFVHGGWAFRYGPKAVAGDKFKLGPLLETGTLLLGRRTWQKFSQIWPTRTDEFSIKMNHIPKLVVSNTLERVDAWNNSALLSGNLIDEVRKRSDQESLIVVGSDSIIQELRRCGLVNEYRLLIFPIVLGEGRRLFPEGEAVAMQLLDVMQSGEAILARLAPVSDSVDKGRSPLPSVDNVAAPFSSVR